jgi:hypothetical protein
VTVLRNGKGFVLSTEGALLATHPAKIPDFISGDFTGFVVDQDACICARSSFSEGSRRIALISDIPITPNLLLPTAERLGSVTLIPLNPHRHGDTAGERKPVNAGRCPLGPIGST